MKFYLYKKKIYKINYFAYEIKIYYEIDFIRYSNISFHVKKKKGLHQ